MNMKFLPTYPRLVKIAHGSARRYGTRFEHEDPLAKLRAPKKPFINWKTTGLFFALGAYIAYDEKILNWYETFTDTSAVNVELMKTLLEYKLTQTPCYQELNHPESKKSWIKSKGWTKSIKHDSSILRELDQFGGLFVQPVTFFNEDTKETVSIIHVGSRLCGYPFIVHGGIIATLLSEEFKRNATLSSKGQISKAGVEELQISYKSPLFSNQYITIKVVEEGGNLKGTVLSESGKVCMKSSAKLDVESNRWRIFQRL